MENKKMPKGGNKQEDFFDDCPICQAMKAAQERGKDLSLEELHQAFAKAKEGGAIVGGEWFDKKDGKQ